MSVKTSPPFLPSCPIRVGKGEGQRGGMAQLPCLSFGCQSPALRDMQEDFTPNWARSKAPISDLRQCFTAFLSLQSTGILHRRCRLLFKPTALPWVPFTAPLRTHLWRLMHLQQPGWQWVPTACIPADELSPYEKPLTSCCGFQSKGTIALGMVNGVTEEDTGLAGPAPTDLQ